MEKKRSVNYEWLRILCMLMIVMLHLLGNGHGNVLSKTIPFSAVYYVTWTIEAFCVVAVNCYVLISGYFLVESRFSWGRVLKLCVQVWFYSIFIFGILAITGKVELSSTALLTACMPVLNRSYGFFSSYLGMLVLSPFLNVLAKSLKKREFQYLLLICIGMFSIITTVYPVCDTFSTGGGTGVVWFCVLYLTAAYIRIHDIGKNISSGKWLSGYVAASVILALSKFSIAILTQSVLGHSVGTSIFYGYESPVCFISSVCLFMAFRNSTKKGRMDKAVLAVSGTTFGVYLIHDNPFLRPVIWQIFAPENVDGNLFRLILLLIGIVMGIFLVCCAVEVLRRFLFRIIGIDRFFDHLKKRGKHEA